MRDCPTFLLRPSFIGVPPDPHLIVHSEPPSVKAEFPKLAIYFFCAGAELIIEPQFLKIFGSGNVGDLIIGLKVEVGEKDLVVAFDDADDFRDGLGGLVGDFSAFCPVEVVAAVVVAESFVGAAFERASALLALLFGGGGGRGCRCFHGINIA